MRKVNEIVSVDEMWIKGKTFRYDHNGFLENTTEWVKLTDHAWLNKFWFVIETDEQYELILGNITKENAGYLSNIFDGTIWIDFLNWFLFITSDFRSLRNDFSKFIINDMSRIANEYHSTILQEYNAIDMKQLFDAHFISKTIDKKGVIHVLEEYINRKDINTLISENKIVAVDTSELDVIIQNVFSENIEKIKSDSKILNWCIGQVMKKFGKCDAVYVKTQLEQLLANG